METLRSQLMLKKIGLLLLIVFLVVIFVMFDVPQYLQIERLREWLSQFGLFAPVAFGLIYFVVTLTGLSTVVLTALAGTLFGLWIGWFLVITAATLSAGVAFYIGRYFSSVFESLLNSPRVQAFYSKLQAQAEKNGFMAIVVVRMTFAPYIYVSYAAGLVKGLTMRDFVLATFVTNMINSFIFTFIGDSITENWYIFVGALIVLLLFMQIPKLIKHLKKN